jgi:F-type H+-transporting ATPase subunit a
MMLEDNFVLYGPLSPNLVSSLIIIVFLAVSFILIGKKVNQLDPRQTPKGFMLAMVLIVDTFNKFIKEQLPGTRFKTFAPYLFTIFVFLAFANTVSLFGLNPPLSNLGVALSFSVMSLFMIKFSEMKYQGVKKKLISLLGPVLPIAPLMLPINLIGEISTPVTMGMRLFGNLMSGTIVSIMVYTALHWTLGIFAGIFVHAIFDIFFGLIQAFVFFMLSLVTISMGSDA